ncbi:MAG: ATP-binding protein [Nannocystaceae bacterium]|nr:ATP-binding protein [Nannocystaceae bacterium]
MIVILNGPPGVGKSTVSRALARRLPGTVCIHGDDLRAFAPENPREHLGGGSTHRAAAVLACAYLEMGAPRVLFDYCFLRPAHVAYFKGKVAAEVKLEMFTLWASLETVRVRDRARTGRSRLGVAVEECYVEIQRHLPAFGEVLDAENPVENLVQELTSRL